MVVDKRKVDECVEVRFRTEGEFTEDEMRKLLRDLRLVIEGRFGTSDITIIRL